MAKVTRIGNSAGIVLSKDVMEKLGLVIGDEVEVTVRGSLLEVQPVVKRPRLRPELEKALERTVDKFGDDLRRLAE